MVTNLLRGNQCVVMASFKHNINSTATKTTAIATFQSPRLSSFILPKYKQSDSKLTSAMLIITPEKQRHEKDEAPKYWEEEEEKNGKGEKEKRDRERGGNEKHK